MTPEQQFERAIRYATADALKAGISPIYLAGLLDFKKSDLRDMMRTAAQKQERNGIVPVTVLPNGE